MAVRSRRGLMAVFQMAFAFLAALCVLTPHGAAARAQGAAPERLIAVVYDDSGSMRYKDGRDSLKNYAYANYSLQNLAALTGEGDAVKIYRMSDRGEHPVDVKRQKDLSGEFKGLTAVKDGRTYAGAIGAALRDGAGFLKTNATGRFLFVLVTDGDVMYEDDGKQLKGSLAGLFSGYVEECGLHDMSGRARALLLSIGTAAPLAPVIGMEEALKSAGIPARLFLADVTGEDKAGERIMAAMAELAEAMAGTRSMEVEPDKPFEVRYPLESLVVMEQFSQGGVPTVQGLAGGGEELEGVAFCRTQAPGGVGVASAFSSVIPRSGCIQPGQYTLKASGSARTVVFPKVGFEPEIVLRDGGGNAAAGFRDGKWSVESISLETGAVLSAEVAFAAAGGAAMELDPHVQMEFESAECFACEAAGQGRFALRAAKAGTGALRIDLSDPAYFQLSLPPVTVAVADAAARPAGSAAATAAPAPQAVPPEMPPAEPSAPASAPWRGLFRWPWWAIEAAALALIAVYAAGLVLKRRIPLEAEAFASGSEDMSASTKLELGRNMLRRNLMPFKREVYTLGPLELYPHPRDKKLFVLSSVAVLHGLRIDGKPPQHHKARDKAGDYVLGPDNVVGVCEGGVYRYYRIVYPGAKVCKRAAKTHKHMRK